MSIHITEIQKQKFVCGLFWQSLSRPRELKKEAAQLAKRINFDLMVLRKDYLTAQAGFAQSREGVKRNAYSLGAAVAQTVAQEGAVYDGQRQRVQNWLGAFKLPDGQWVYFAVRDANFLPNGDFAGSKEEVLERLQGDYGLGGWNAVIGDAELEDYGFHNFNAKPIEELLPRDRRGGVRVQSAWALRPVTHKIPRAALIGGAAFLVLSAGGVLYYQQLLKAREAREREEAMEAMRKKLQAEAAQKEPPHPWAGMPLPLPMVQACLERFEHLTPGGWRLDEFSCTPTRAHYTWSRQGSAVEFLLEKLPKASVDLNGERATWSQPLGTLATENETLTDEKSLLEPVVSRLQLMSLKPTIVKSKPPAPEKRFGRKEPPPPSWNSYSLRVPLGAIPPAEVAAILARPGIRIEKLTYRGNAWSLEGVAYAK